MRGSCEKEVATQMRIQAI